MGKVKVKMELEFWYDPETNEYTPISNKVIDNKPKVKNKVETATVDNNKAILTLTDNKYILNQTALNLLQAQVEDRITIKYNRVDGSMQPFIGLDSVFGTKGGNKLTKSSSVSFRGENNKRLSSFGEIFELIPSKTEGIFLLKGDKEIEVVSDENISVTESSDLEDLQKLAISEDLDLDGSEEITFNLVL